MRISESKLRSEYEHKADLPQTLNIEVVSEGFSYNRFYHSNGKDVIYKVPTDINYIQVDGIDVVREEGFSYGRGLNIAVIDPGTGKLCDFAVFDTGGIEKNQKARDSLVSFIERISKGKIIALTTIDEAVADLYVRSNEQENKRINRLFEALGSKVYPKLNPYLENQEVQKASSFRSAWSLVTVKGSENSLQEAFVPRVINIEDPWDSSEYSKAKISINWQTFDYLKLKQKFGDNIDAYSLYLIFLCDKNTLINYLEVTLKEITATGLNDHCKGMVKTIVQAQSFEDLLNTVFKNNRNQCGHLSALSDLEALLSPEIQASRLSDMKPKLLEALSDVMTHKIQSYQKICQSKFNHKKAEYKRYFNDFQGNLKRQTESILNQILSHYHFISSLPNQNEVKKIKSIDQLIEHLKKLSLLDPSIVNPEQLEELRQVLSKRKESGRDSFADIRTVIENIFETVQISRHETQRLILKTQGGEHLALSSLVKEIEAYLAKYPEYKRKDNYQAPPKSDSEKKSYPCSLLPVNQLPTVDPSKIATQEKGIYLYKVGDGLVRARVIHDNQMIDELDLTNFAEDEPEIQKILSEIEWPSHDKKVALNTTLVDFIFDLCCGVRDIYIDVPGTLYLDCDLKIPGKNLIINATTVNVKKNCTIDLSGRKGRLFESKNKYARSGEEVRKSNNRADIENRSYPGDDGGHGPAGESSGNFILNAELMHDEGRQLKVVLNGGDGAAGQAGGDGEKGADGKDGIDGEVRNERRFFHLRSRVYVVSATDPKPGCDGGDGGAGGRGGEGGYAGTFKFNGETLTIPDNKLLMLEGSAGNDQSHEEAANGKGGVGGSGGKYALDYVCPHVSLWSSSDAGKYFKPEHANDQKGGYIIEERWPWWLFGVLQEYLIKPKEKDHKKAVNSPKRTNSGNSGKQSKKTLESKQKNTAKKNELIPLKEGKKQFEKLVKNIKKFDNVYLNDKQKKLEATEGELEALNNELEEYAELGATISALIKEGKENVKKGVQVKEQISAEILAPFGPSKARKVDRSESQKIQHKNTYEEAQFSDKSSVKNNLFNQYKSQLSADHFVHLENLLVKLEYEVESSLKAEYEPLVEKLIEGNNRHLLEIVCKDIQLVDYVCKNNLEEKLRSVLGFKDDHSLSMPLLILEFRKRHLITDGLTELNKKILSLNENKNFQNHLSGLVEHQCLQEIGRQFYQNLKDQLEISQEDVSPILDNIEVDQVISKVHQWYGVIKKDLVSAGIADAHFIHEESLSEFSEFLVSKEFKTDYLGNINVEFFLDFYQRLKVYKQYESFIQLRKSIYEKIKGHLTGLLEEIKSKFFGVGGYSLNSAISKFNSLLSSDQKEYSEIVRKFDLILLFLPYIQIEKNEITGILNDIDKIRSHPYSKKDDCLNKIISQLNKVATILNCDSSITDQEKSKDIGVQQPTNSDEKLKSSYQSVLQKISLTRDSIVKQIDQITRNNPLDNDAIARLKNNVDRLFDEYHCQSEFDRQVLEKDLTCISKIIGKNFDSIIADIDVISRFQDNYSDLSGKFSSLEGIDNFINIFSLIENRYLSHKKMGVREKFNVVSELLESILNSNLSASDAYRLLNGAFPDKWLSYLLHEQLHLQVLRFINNANKSQPEEKVLPDAIAQMLYHLIDSPIMMNVMLEKLRQENNLVNDLSRITLRDFTNIFDGSHLSLLMKNETALYLRALPIGQWTSYFKKITWLEKLPCLKEDKTLKQKMDHLIDAFFNRFDEKIVKQFIEIISSYKQPNYPAVIDAMHYLIRHESLCSKKMLEYLGQYDQENWLNILNEKWNDLIKNKEDLSTTALIENLELDFDVNNNDVTPKVLENCLNDIKNFHYSKCFAKPISEWTAEDIQEKWIQYVAKRKIKNKKWVQEHLPEVLAVLGHGVKLIYQYEPRDTQLLALLLYMDAENKDKGRLGQVSTGEGKTVTNAMLGIVHALIGNPVNIITSSSVLAERDAEETEALYKCFGLTVSNNCDKTAQDKIEERKKRYQSPVVYGDVGSFQRDLLLTDSMDGSILARFKNAILIVDEVDSMLLDKGDNTLYLSHEIVDFRHLRHLYVEIWNAINSPDINKYTESDFSERVKKNIQEKINNKTINIPSYLNRFVEYRLSIWIRYALYTRELVEKNQYIDDKNNIIIMDNDTGVEQESMRWSNGLHQFLQLLKLKKLSSESLKAIFQSNLSFFQSYIGKIYGISGTLGTQSDKKLFEQLYQVDSFKMPRFRPHRFYEEEGVVVNDEAEWLVEMVNALNAHDKRPALVICESVERVEKVSAFLKEKMPTCSLHIRDKSSKKLTVGNKKNPLKAGDIIIATNLAGRGADLLVTEEAEEAGGLYEISSCNTSNIRVERQAFGRVARQGQKGSAKCIILNKDVNDLYDLRRQRDWEAMQRLEQIRVSTVQSIYTEESLFKKFSETCDEVKKILNTEYSDKFQNEYEKIQLKSLKDRWAFWLDEQDQLIKDVTKIGAEFFLKLYQKFHDDIIKIVKKNEFYKFVESPHELIALGRCCFLHGNENRALACFEKVIEQYPYHAEIAHHWKARILSHQSGANKNRAEIKKALKSEHVLLGQRMHEDLIPADTALLSAIAFNRSEGKGQSVNNFEVQIKNELSLYQVHLAAITNIIGKPISADMFKNALTSDKQRKKLYETFIQKSRYVKGYRLNPKLIMKHKDNRKEIIIQTPIGSKKLILPKILSNIESLLVDHIEKKLKAEFFLNKKEFSDFIQSQERLWELLKKHELVLEKTSFHMLNLSKSKLENVLKEYKFYDEVKNVLLKNNKKQFDMSLFSDYLSDDEIVKLKALLQSSGQLVFVKSGCFSANYDLSNSLLLPPELKPYHSVLSNLVNDHQNEREKAWTFDIKSTQFCLPENDDQALDLLWKSLIDQGVVKSPKINISTKSKDRSEKIEKIKSWIKSEVSSLMACEFIVVIDDAPTSGDLKKVKEGKAVLFEKHGEECSIHFIDTDKVYCHRYLGGGENYKATLLPADIESPAYHLTKTPLDTEEEKNLIGKEQVVFFELSKEKNYLIHFCYEGKEYRKRTIVDEQQIQLLNTLFSDEVFSKEAIKKDEHVKQLKAILMSFGGRIHESDYDELLKKDGYFSPAFRLIEKVMSSLSSGAYSIINNIFSANSTVNNLKALKNSSNKKRVVVTELEDIANLTAIAERNGYGIPKIIEKQVASINEIIDQHIGQMKLFPEFTGSVKNLQKYFEQGECPPEIFQFSDMLFDEVLTFNKKINRWSWGAFAVAMLGVAQIALGIALEVFTTGFASSLGAVLIAEGIGDMIFATQAGLTGQFTWKAYGMHKAISVAMSAMTVCTMGVGAIASAGGLAGLASNTVKLSKAVIVDVIFYAGKRVALEVGKAIGGKIAEIALTKICDQLPHEIALLLNSGLKSGVENSKAVQENRNILRNTMTALFRITDAKHAQQIIEDTIAITLRDSQDNTTFDQIIETACSLASEIPKSILLATTGMTAFGLDLLFGALMGGIQSAYKISRLISMTPSIYEALNKNLMTQIKTINTVNQGDINNAVTEVDRQYIETRLTETNEAITKIVIKKATDEILKPGLMCIAQKAIHAVTSGIQKSNQQELQDIQMTSIAEVHGGYGMNLAEEVRRDDSGHVEVGSRRNYETRNWNRSRENRHEGEWIVQTQNNGAYRDLHGEVPLSQRSQNTFVEASHVIREQPGHRRGPLSAVETDRHHGAQSSWVPREERPARVRNPHVSGGGQAACSHSQIMTPTLSLNQTRVRSFDAKNMITTSIDIAIKAVVKGTKIYAAVEMMHTKYRIKSVELEILREKLEKEKQENEIKKQTCEDNKNFIKLKESARRNHNIKVLEMEILDRENEIKSIEQEIKLDFFSDLKKIKPDSENYSDDYKIKILEAQIKAYNDIGVYSTFGSQKVKSLLLDIIKKYREETGIDSEKLNLLERSIKIFSKKETDLEQQISLLKWLKEISTSENSNDVENFFETWGLNSLTLSKNKMEKKMRKNKLLKNGQLDQEKNKAEELTSSDDKNNKAEEMREENSLEKNQLDQEKNETADLTLSDSKDNASSVTNNTNSTSSGWNKQDTKDVIRDAAKGLKAGSVIVKSFADCYTAHKNLESKRVDLEIAKTTGQNSIKNAEQERLTSAQKNQEDLKIIEKKSNEERQTLRVVHEDNQKERSMKTEKNIRKDERIRMELSINFATAEQNRSEQSLDRKRSQLKDHLSQLDNSMMQLLKLMDEAEAKKTEEQKASGKISPYEQRIIDKYNGLARDYETSYESFRELMGKDIGDSASIAKNIYGVFGVQKNSSNSSNTNQPSFGSGNS